jgi:hypothetical protein
MVAMAMAVRVLTVRITSPVFVCRPFAPLRSVRHGTLNERRFRLAQSKSTSPHAFLAYGRLDSCEQDQRLGLSSAAVLAGCTGRSADRAAGRSSHGVWVVQ